MIVGATFGTSERGYNNTNVGTKGDDADDDLVV
jgi:hypothetical protein